MTSASAIHAANRLAFAYNPLVQPDNIRLILLHPSPDISAELECTTEQATLSRYAGDLIHHYIALSYVWGDANDRRQICVDGCALDTMANLDSALRHIRDAKSILKVWADAISINQANAEERNH